MARKQCLIYLGTPSSYRVVESCGAEAMRMTVAAMHMAIACGYCVWGRYMDSCCMRICSQCRVGVSISYIERSVVQSVGYCGWRLRG